MKVSLEFLLEISDEFSCEYRANAITWGMYSMSSNSLGQTQQGDLLLLTNCQQG